MTLTNHIGIYQWARMAAGNNHFARDRRASPELKYTNHKKAQHQGQHNPACNACRELKTKVTQ